MSDKTPCWGVYKQLADGRLKYIPRTATHSQKLATEVAKDFTDGVCVMPDGSTRQIKPIKCVVRMIETEEAHT